MQQVKREWMPFLSARIARATIRGRCVMGEIVTPAGRVEVVLRQFAPNANLLQGQRLADGDLSVPVSGERFFISDELAAILEAAAAEADDEARQTQTERERVMAFLAALPKTGGYRGGSRSADGQFRIKYNREQPQPSR